jgi:hypothetical protein
MSLDDTKQDDIIGDGNADGHQIGPGQPPKDYQFKNGASGNPKGRPNKPPKSHELLWEELRKPIKFRSGDKIEHAPMLQIVYRQLISLAKGGNSQAAKLFFVLRENVMRRKNNYKEEEDQPVVFEWTEEHEQLWRDLQKWEPDQAETDNETDDEKAESNTFEASSPSHAPTVDTLLIAQPESGAETLSAVSAADGQISNKLKDKDHD